jgi:bifunctional oligoribonuclease and PAP phosphatase NrnA
MKANVSIQMAEELRKAPKVALFSHVSPDGDCLGSMLAIGLALEKMGKEVHLINPDPIPHYLSFLPGVNKVQRFLPEHLPQTLLFVDCGDLQRANLKLDQIPMGSIVLNLDHHVSNNNFGTINWVDVKASASGEIALALIRELKVELNQEIAMNLYTAILTDTGSFQYSNTTATTHRLAADLLESGINLVEVHHRIYDQKPLAQVKLLQCALTKLQLYLDGKCAIMSLSQEDFKETGADESLSEGLVNHARSIQGVEIAVLLKEVELGKVRVGLRSNLWFNVNETAARFGGGGHKRASGCTLNTSLKEAEQLIVRAIEEDMQIGRSD